MNLARRAAGATWAALAERAAEAYVAGPAVEDALRACQALAARGVSTTICRWNHPETAPSVVAATYLAALSAMGKARLDCYLSIKAPALGMSGDLVGAVVARARANSVLVHFDAQKWDSADRTFALIDAAAATGHPIGCALPGRWRRSLLDAERAIERGLRVRVVKGQQPDPLAPERDLREGFLEVIDRLAGRARQVAVATHDAPLAREALGRLRAAGTPAELELLLGLPFAAARREAELLGVPVRVYIPYGQPEVPYHYSSIRRDPRVLGWLVQDLLFKGPSQLFS
jgi:proline dehydrogenase